MKKLIIALILLFIPMQCLALTVYFVDGKKIDAEDINMAYPEGTANAPNPFSASYEDQKKKVAIAIKGRGIFYCTTDDIDWEKTNIEIRLDRVEKNQKAAEQRQQADRDQHDAAQRSRIDDLERRVDRQQMDLENQRN